MYANRSSYDAARTVVSVHGSAASRRSDRRLRREALRHDRLTLGDHVAYWRANRRGRMCSRGRTVSPWSASVRVAFVMVFLVAALTVGALFT